MKEATLTSKWNVGSEIFQSTPPRRRRPIRKCFTHYLIWFQSTPPKRRRQYLSGNQGYPTCYFNPHLQEGGDTLFRQKRRMGVTFQSTPPRRRRLGDLRCLAGYGLFQSTPPRRRRQYGSWFSNRICRFQSTPPRRRRLLPFSSTTLSRYYFNPRLQEGGDCNILWYLSYHVHI